MIERLVDAIKDGQIVTLPETIAHEEELFILRVHEKRDPSASLPSIESRRRFRETPIHHQKPVARWHSYEPEYKKNNVIKELIDNFQWELNKARKARSMTRLQLANTLGVSEHIIQMVENGELPSDDFVLINKLQNYFGINIRRDGKTFEVPSLSLSDSSSKKPVSMGPAYIPKPDFTRADISLSDLQKIKETREKARNTPSEQFSKSAFSGSDIELF